ncbi:hypothetical protein B0T17DRAFT_590430 [Bombardia bombarda]|uniref:Uncharacterized protein n=1 Tax=Bombardia bombarda TaxID=252184 RepID=A0AA39WZI9_9PEZI|nr:hypothetical protein B0T17DRAFT_590430 [Bombardia bombarda]
MPRRPATKASRATGTGASAVPTPAVIPSNYTTTPISSAYPSTYASEAEWDLEDVAIGALTLDDAADSAEVADKKAAKPKPFRLMDLPSELRNKIYSFYFSEIEGVIDLDYGNHKRIHKKLCILKTCRMIYYEASYVFYSTHTFRVFPTSSGRFLKTKKPLLARLNSRQRSLITSLEVRLGPGFGHQPPRGWVVNPALGLPDCVNLRRLTVYVECDPSDGIFNGFRKADGFYENFCSNLLKDVLNELPPLNRVYFDAWPSVKKSGGMMRSLLDVAMRLGKKIYWGPDRGWTDHDEKDAKHTTVANNIWSVVGINVSVVS